jgi:glutamate carboxypeptidase
LIFPFKYNKRDYHVVELAKAAGYEVGLKIQNAISSEETDVNITSAMGIPTLDGLDPAVSFAHNRSEYIELDYLPTKVALVKRIGETYYTPTKWNCFSSIAI